MARGKQIIKVRKSKLKEENKLDQATQLGQSLSGGYLFTYKSSWWWPLLDAIVNIFLKRAKSVQFSYSFMSNSLWPMDCSTPGFPAHHQLPELAQTDVHWVSDAIQPSHPLLSPSSPAFNLSQHQSLFKWVSSSHQVVKVKPKYWSFGFSINLSNEYSGLISFRMDWLDLLAVQGTLKSLLQHHSSKASILWCSVYFMVQLSHL